MKKLILAALLCGASLSSQADVTNVNVLYLDGTSHVVKMTDVDKINLSAGTISVVQTDGQTTSHAMKDVDKIVFQNTTGIASLRANDKVNITVRSDGYSFVVSGLKAYDTAVLYTQDGRLAAKAKAIDGNATIDASSLANGVYVIKAAGRSLKMIKR